ncbi:MAG: hypothetical protein IRZ15_13290 [Bryobacteraceae bacterium]|nr:hypothetical protein [Bryobacteraceae bacterium]
MPSDQGWKYVALVGRSIGRVDRGKELRGPETFFWQPAGQLVLEDLPRLLLWQQHICE